MKIRVMVSYVINLFCNYKGPRYGDYKCIHDRTHRVCAKLVDNPTSCNELAWNSNGRSFWDITGQQRWNWKDRICSRPNPGDSWCICMWATANLIREVRIYYKVWQNRTRNWSLKDNNNYFINIQNVIGWMWKCSYQLCCYWCKLCT